jgi:hypothetical protein
MRIPIMRLPRLLLVLAPFTLAVPADGTAQTGPTSLSSGARVRVRAASLGPTARTARVVTAGADTIVVRPDDASGFDVTLPRAEITQLDVSEGRRTRKARMALVGSGVGSVVGYIAGAASFSDPCKTEPAVCAGFFYETRGSDAFAGALAGALLGAAAGAITGQLWKTDRWRSYPIGARSGALRILPAPSRRASMELVLTMNVRD